MIRLIFVVLHKKMSKVFANCEFVITFAASEGRNPWVKNAFLALSYTIKSPNFTRRDEDKDTFILFCI